MKVLLGGLGRHDRIVDGACPAEQRHRDLPHIGAERAECLLCGLEAGRDAGLER
jgi:hypothetical protein